MKKNKKKWFLIGGSIFLGLSLVTAIGLHSFNQGVINNTFSSDLDSFFNENEKNINIIKEIYNKKDNIPYHRKDEFKDNEREFFSGTNSSSNTSSSEKYNPFSINNQKERYKHSHVQYTLNYDSQLTNTFDLRPLQNKQVIKDLVFTRFISLSKSNNNPKLELLKTSVFKEKLLEELKKNKTNFASLIALFEQDTKNIYITELKLKLLQETTFEKNFLKPLFKLQKLISSKLDDPNIKNNKETFERYKTFEQNFVNRVDVFLDYLSKNFQELEWQNEFRWGSIIRSRGYQKVANSLLIDSQNPLPKWKELEKFEILSQTEKNDVPSWYKSGSFYEPRTFQSDISSILVNNFKFKSPFLIIKNVKFNFNNKEFVSPKQTTDENIHTTRFEELKTLFANTETLIGKYTDSNNLPRFVFSHPNNTNDILFEVYLDQQTLDSLSQSEEYDIKNYELNNPSKIKVYFYRDSENKDLLDVKKTNGLVQLERATPNYLGVKSIQSGIQTIEELNNIRSQELMEVGFENSNKNIDESIIETIKDDYALIWVNNWHKVGFPDDNGNYIQTIPTNRDFSFNLKSIIDRFNNGNKRELFQNDWLNVNNPHKQYVNFKTNTNDSNANVNLDYFFPENSILWHTPFESNNNTIVIRNRDLRNPYYPLVSTILADTSYLATRRFEYKDFPSYSLDKIYNGGILHDFLNNGFILVKKNELKNTTQSSSTSLKTITNRDIQHILANSSTKLYDNVSNIDRYVLKNGDFDISASIPGTQIANSKSWDLSHNLLWFLKQRDLYLNNKKPNINGFYPLYSLPTTTLKEINSNSSSNAIVKKHQKDEISKANNEYLELFEEIVLKNREEWVSSRKIVENVPITKYKTYFDHIPISIWKSIFKTKLGQEFKKQYLEQNKRSQVNNSTQQYFPTNNTWNPKLQKYELNFYRNTDNATRRRTWDHIDRFQRIGDVRWNDYKLTHLLVSPEVFRNELNYRNRLYPLRELRNVVYDYEHLPFKLDSKILILPFVTNKDQFKNENRIPKEYKNQIFKNGNYVLIPDGTTIKKYMIVPILYRQEDILPIKVAEELSLQREIESKNKTDNADVITELKRRFGNNIFSYDALAPQYVQITSSADIKHYLYEKFRNFLGIFMKVMIMRFTDNIRYRWEGNPNTNEKNARFEIFNNGWYHYNYLQDSGYRSENNYILNRYNQYLNNPHRIFKKVYSFMLLGDSMDINKNVLDNNVQRQNQLLDSILNKGLDILNLNLEFDFEDRLESLLNSINRDIETLRNNNDLNTVYSVSYLPFLNKGYMGSKEHFTKTDLKISDILDSNSNNSWFRSILNVMIKSSNSNTNIVLKKALEKLLNFNNKRIFSNVHQKDNSQQKVRLILNYFINNFNYSSYNSDYRDFTSDLFDNTVNLNTRLSSTTGFNKMIGNNVIYQTYDLMRYINWLPRNYTYFDPWFLKNSNFNSNISWISSTQSISDKIKFYTTNDNDYFITNHKGVPITIESHKKRGNLTNEFKKITITPYIKGSNLLKFESSEIEYFNFNSNNVNYVNDNNGYRHVSSKFFKPISTNSNTNNVDNTVLPKFVPRSLIWNYSKYVDFIRKNFLQKYNLIGPKDFDNNFNENNLYQEIELFFKELFKKGATNISYDHLLFNTQELINTNQSKYHPIRILYYLDSGQFFKDFSHNKFVDQKTLNDWFYKKSGADLPTLQNDNWIDPEDESLFELDINPNRWFLTRDGLYKIKINRRFKEDERSYLTRQSRDNWSNFVDYSNHENKPIIQNSSRKMDVYAQNVDNVVLKDNLLISTINDVTNIITSLNDNNDLLQHQDVYQNLKTYLQNNERFISNKLYDKYEDPKEVDNLLKHVVRNYFHKQLEQDQVYQINNVESREITSGFKRWDLKTNHLENNGHLWKDVGIFIPLFQNNQQTIPNHLNTNDLVTSYNILKEKYKENTIRILLDIFFFNKTSFKKFSNYNDSVILSDNDKKIYNAFKVFDVYYQNLIDPHKTNINSWLFLFKHIIGVDKFNREATNLLPNYIINNTSTSIDLNDWFNTSLNNKKTPNRFDNIFNFAPIVFNDKYQSEWFSRWFDFVFKQPNLEINPEIKKYNVDYVKEKIKSYNILNNVGQDDNEKIHLTRNTLKYNFGKRSGKIVRIEDYTIGVKKQQITNNSNNQNIPSNWVKGKLSDPNQEIFVYFEPYSRFDYASIYNYHNPSQKLTDNQMIFLIDEQIDTNDYITFNTSIPTNDSNPSTRAFKTTKQFMIIDLDKVVNFNEYIISFILNHPTYGEILFNVRFNPDTNRHELIIGDYYKSQLNNEIINDIKYLDHFNGMYNKNDNKKINLSNLSLELKVQHQNTPLNSIIENETLVNNFKNKDQNVNYLDLTFKLKPNNITLTNNNEIWYDNNYGDLSVNTISNIQNLKMIESIWYTFSSKKDIMFKPQFNIDVNEFYNNITSNDNRDRSNYSVTNNIPIYSYINNRLINLLNLLFDPEKMQHLQRVALKDFVRQYSKPKLKNELDSYQQILSNSNDPMALLINKNVRIMQQILEGINQVTKTTNDNQTTWIHDGSSDNATIMFNLNSTKSISEVIKTGVVYIYNNSKKLDQLIKRYRQFTTLNELTNEQLVHEIKRLTEVNKTQNIDNNTQIKVPVIDVLEYKLKTNPLKELIDEQLITINKFANPIISLRNVSDNKELNDIFKMFNAFLKDNKTNILFNDANHKNNIDTLLTYYLTYIYQSLKSKKLDPTVVNNDQFNSVLEKMYEGASEIKHYEFEIDPENNDEYSFGSYIITPIHSLEWYTSKINRNKQTVNSKVHPLNLNNVDFTYDQDNSHKIIYNSSSQRIFDVNTPSNNNSSTPYDDFNSNISNNKPRLHYQNNAKEYLKLKEQNISRFAYAGYEYRYEQEPIREITWQEYQNQVISFLEILRDDFYYLENFLKKPQSIINPTNAISGFDTIMGLILPLINLKRNPRTQLLESDKPSLTIIINNIHNIISRYIENKNKVEEMMFYNKTLTPNKKDLRTDSFKKIVHEPLSTSNTYLVNNDDGFVVFKNDSDVPNDLDDAIRLIKINYNLNNYDKNNTNNNNFNVFNSLNKVALQKLIYNLKNTSPTNVEEYTNKLMTNVILIQQNMLLYNNVTSVDPWFDQDLGRDATRTKIKDFVENPKNREMTSFIQSLIGWTTYINQSFVGNVIRGGTSWKPIAFWSSLIPGVGIINIGLTIVDTVSKYLINKQELQRFLRTLSSINQQIKQLTEYLEISTNSNENIAIQKLIAKLFDVNAIQSKIEELNGRTHWVHVVGSFFTDLFAGWYYAIWRNPTFDDKLNYNINRLHKTQVYNMITYLTTMGLWDNRLILDTSYIDEINKNTQFVYPDRPNNPKSEYTSNIKERVFVFRVDNEIITLTEQIEPNPNPNFTIDNELLDINDLKYFPYIEEPTYTGYSTNYNNNDDETKIKQIIEKYNNTYERLFGKKSNISNLESIRKEN